MTDENENIFENDTHIYDAGMLLGYLNGKKVPATQQLAADDISYTPIIRIEIEGQLPIWVRVLPR